MRYTIRRQGMILGTYEGKTEADALDALAQDEGYVDFDECCMKMGLVRDNYTMMKVED